MLWEYRAKTFAKRKCRKITRGKLSLTFFLDVQMGSKEGNYWDMGIGKYWGTALCASFAISTDLVLSGNDRWDAEFQQSK